MRTIKTSCAKNNSLRKLLRTAPLKKLRNSKVIEEQGDGGKKVPEKNSFSFSRQCENRCPFIFFIEVQKAKPFMS